MSFSWLPISERKGISVPSVIFEPNIGQNYGGYYCYTRQLICAVECEDIDRVLAHEFRHHVQLILNLYPNCGSDISLFSKYSYNKAIREYFKQPWEMDALLFEHRVCPSYTSNFWLKGLILPPTLDEELWQ